jgi:hypothetical protein
MYWRSEIEDRRSESWWNAGADAGEMLVQMLVKTGPIVASPWPPVDARQPADFQQMLGVLRVLAPAADCASTDLFDSTKIWVLGCPKFGVQLGPNFR